MKRKRRYGARRKDVHRANCRLRRKIEGKNHSSKARKQFFREARSGFWTIMRLIMRWLLRLI